MTCGLTPDQVSGMSFAQLKLWHQAAERRRAENALLQFRAVQAAMCGDKCLDQFVSDMRRML